MPELTEKAKLARSIPAKKKRKSTWCRGFILSKPMDDYAIHRASLLKEISTSHRCLRSKTYRE